MLYQYNGSCELSPIPIVHQMKYKKDERSEKMRGHTRTSFICKLPKLFDTIASAFANTQNHLLAHMLFLCFCSLVSFCPSFFSVGCIFPLVSPDFLCTFLPRKKRLIQSSKQNQLQYKCKNRFTNRLKIQMSKSVASNTIEMEKNSDRQQTYIRVYFTHSTEKVTKTRTNANGKQYKILIVWKWNWNLYTRTFAFLK